MSEETNSWEKILQPCIILVRPQLGENIGMCARAMLNCGLTEMRIVAPRDGWPNPAAVSASAGAGSVLENAGVYASLEEASADLHHLIATTNRLRDMVKPIYSPEGAMGFTRDSVTKGERVGIVFGPERTGLENTDIAQCGSVLTIPLNPGFSSLNLAQAVLVVSYEWARLARFGDVEARIERTGESDWATKDQLNLFLRNLDEHLDNKEFYRSKEMKPSVWENIRNMFSRAQWTSQEIQTLHGVLRALTGTKQSKS